MSVLIDAALAEAQRWPVFPLAHDKRPVVSGGFMAATQDPADIRRMVSLPGAELVGVPTGEVSGIDVLDIDPDKGGFSWQDDHAHEIPDTEYQLTRKPGGMHYLFRHHPGMRSSASKIGPGVDVRGDGGYIVRWSATTGSGRRIGKVADWPAWLVIEASRKRLLSTGAGALQPDQLAPPDMQTLLDFLDALPNPESCGRDDYVAVCMAVQGCIRGLEAMNPDLDPEPIIHAAASWAARWEGPNPGDYEAERAKWESDWGQRDDDLAGWRQLRAAAKRLGVDTAPVVQSSAVAAFGADPMPDEPDPLARLVGWRDDLMLDKTGGILSNVKNALTMLQGDPRLADVLAYDEMQRATILLRAVGDRMRGEFPRRPSDADVTQIQAFLQRAGLAHISKDATWQAIEARAQDNRQHPLRNYLDGLAHDGVARVETWLTRYCGAEDTPVNRAIGRMFLIQMVARAMQPGCQADAMLVLEGKQNQGKSTVCRILGGDWAAGNLPDMHRSDAVRLSMHLRGKWLIEVPELAGMSKAETGALKAFITQTEELYVPKYGRAEVIEPRSCVFLGTTNDSQYLRDATGGRRFWPVRCGDTFDTAGLARDRDQIFAEAVALYRAGVPWWPSAATYSLLQGEQEERYEADIWESDISTWLHGRERATLREVASGAMGIARDRLGTAEQRRLAAIMRRLGWEQRRTAQDRWWEPATSASDDGMTLSPQNGVTDNSLESIVNDAMTSHDSIILKRDGSSDIGADNTIGAYMGFCRHRRQGRHGVMPSGDDESLS